MEDLINNRCNLCPRNCGADRYNGEVGYCKAGNTLVVARAALYFWEEPCISGDDGSGTVFFSGCQLRCVYCQNRNIAIGKTGKEISIERLVEIFFELKDKGANNINLVTPSHFANSIRKALEMAKIQGLDLKVVYNTSAYDNVETIKSFDGLVDIYLPDMKYYDSNLSKRYSNAPDYFDVASSAISEMVRQRGKFKINDKGIMENGVIVRHLVLPEATQDSKRIIKYLYDTYGDYIFISIMNQYTPIWEGDALSNYPELRRKITKEEYDEVVDYAIEIGIENGFIQEGDTAKESFIPKFDLEGV